MTQGYILFPRHSTLVIATFKLSVKDISAPMACSFIHLMYLHYLKDL